MTQKYIVNFFQDLPPGKFDDARSAIDTKYTEIERSLIAEFVKSHRSNDRSRMKDLVRNLTCRAENSAYIRRIQRCVKQLFCQVNPKSKRRSKRPKHIILQSILFSFQALILSQFKGYNACIDAFIEQVKFNLTVKSNILICIK